MSDEEEQISILAAAMIIESQIMGISFTQYLVAMHDSAILIDDKPTANIYERLYSATMAMAHGSNN